MSKTERKLPARRVLIVAYDRVQSIDIAGPAQAFTSANDEEVTARYEVTLASLTPGSVQTASGFAVVAEPIPRSGAIDTLIIPGGPGVFRLQEDEAAIAAIKRLTERTRRICAVCTGAFALAATGLLGGRRAVTHWRACARLQREYPDITVDPEPLFIRDGDIWTTAGVTAGIDLALSLIEDDHGAPVAAKVARRLVVYMRRPGGQRQFSEPLELQSTTDASYDGLLQKIAGKPSAPWSVQMMAGEARQSERTFHRKFVAQTGTTPAHAVERVRSELARSLLQTSEAKLALIAAKTGFGSESAMRRALKRQFGVSARELRERFPSAAP
jgi:transcriptional regulator GlxA family with amidase domain